VPTALQVHKQIKMLSFSYSNLSTRPPWKPVGLNVQIDELVKSVMPCAFVGVVSSGHQWPILDLPSHIPMLLISPFGDFCSNGNVRRLYVSGQSNVQKLKLKGIENAEVFFNPLVVPASHLKNSKDIDSVVFGRCGRSDEFIFDPISLNAFAHLEREFGNFVKYIYVNPSQHARALVKELRLNNVEFREWLDEEDLQHFYAEIDVFAHARRDGETLGVAIGEAMLNSCVIVSHKTNFFNEHLFLVREPFGFVSDVDDVNGYFENMKWCVINKDRLQELGETAKLFALPYFSKEVVSKKIVRDCLELASFRGFPLSLHIRIRHGLMLLEFWTCVFFAKLLRIVSSRIKILYRSRRSK
jgi:glycosyltransferase involved in cell wall biosynthesis